MENITQPASEQRTSQSAPDADKTQQQTAIDQPSSSTAPVVSDNPQTSTIADSASQKGKERDSAPPLVKQDSTLAIGDAVDDIKAITPGGSDGPVCIITLLLTSGTRHPYKLDAKYLRRRNVDIPDQTEDGQPDPFSISIYTLKELILREWRSDWEAKPASPSSIRLIHFGKLLDDKEPIKKYQLSNESPNVVHMSIRPQDLDEEEPKSGSKNLSSGGGDGQRSRSGGCCVIL